MKNNLLALALAGLMPLGAMAQYEEDTDNGVVSLAGREGFSIKSKKGDFVFKPYMLVQTQGNFNWYDDEGLDAAYNQDNVHNSGFAIPNAILGFTGRLSVRCLSTFPSTQPRRAAHSCSRPGSTWR